MVFIKHGNRRWCGIEHRFYHGFLVVYPLFQRKLFADITVHAQIVSDLAFAVDHRCDRDFRQI